ncbi:unnamed protein product [Amoebophrya sp. A25]|nr:unnamed protein product [Amoebophrya sp. A25]|eukprot:GSA25T00012076001.1
MRSDIDTRTRRLEQERRHLRDLEEGVLKCRKEYEDRRTRYQKLKRTWQGKQGHGQERLLEMLFQKLNLLHHQDSEYVGDITRLRQERKHLDGIFRQMKSEIQAQTRELIRQTHIYQQAEREKEDMLAQTRSIEKRMKEQRLEFTEMVENMKQDYAKQQRIQRDIDSRRRNAGKNRTTRSNIFGSTRGTMVSSARGDTTQLLGGTAESLIAEEERNFDAKHLCRRIFRNAFFNAIQRRRIKQYSKNIEIFEQAFETIRTLTGIQNLSEIVRIFTQMEDRSYSLLTYVNTLHSDIERLQIENKNALDLHFQHATGTSSGSRGAGSGLSSTASLARKRALLASLQAKIRQEATVVSEKEADIQRELDVIAKVREPLLKTVQNMGSLLLEILRVPDDYVPVSPSGQRFATHRMSSIEYPASPSAGGLNAPSSGTQLLVPIEYPNVLAQASHGRTGRNTIHGHQHHAASSLASPSSPSGGAYYGGGDGGAAVVPVLDLLGFIEQNLLHFRDWLATTAPLRILSKPQVGGGTADRGRAEAGRGDRQQPGGAGAGQRGADGPRTRPQDLPSVAAFWNDSDSEGDDVPLSRVDLRAAVQKSLYARKKKQQKQLPS